MSPQEFGKKMQISARYKKLALTLEIFMYVTLIAGVALCCAGQELSGSAALAATACLYFAILSTVRRWRDFLFELREQIHS